MDGTRRADSGAQLENELRACADWYERQGMATIAKIGPETRGYGRTLRYVGRGPYDFIGVLQGGRAIAFESKSVVGHVSYAHDPEYANQVRRLQVVDSLGGLAFLLLVEQKEHAMILLGPATFAPLLARERITFASRTGGVFALAPNSSHLQCWRGTSHEQMRQHEVIWPFLRVALATTW